MRLVIQTITLKGENVYSPQGRHRSFTAAMFIATFMLGTFIGFQIKGDNFWTAVSFVLAASTAACTTTFYFSKEQWRHVEIVDWLFVVLCVGTSLGNWLELFLDQDPHSRNAALCLACFPAYLVIPLALSRFGSTVGFGLYDLYLWSKAKFHKIHA